MAKRGRPRGSKNKKKRNIPNNFRGSEDTFWTKVVRGFKKFLCPPSKHMNK